MPRPTSFAGCRCRTLKAILTPEGTAGGVCVKRAVAKHLCRRNLKIRSRGKGFWALN